MRYRQRNIFKKDYKYKRKFINACIMRIRFGKRNDATIRGYKTYIFKAMKDIVNKNICNYVKLLEGSPCRRIPEYNEILSECYIIFDKCLEKYEVKKYNSFYFYFNKAMSRKFYKCYQKEVNMPHTELSDEMSAVLPCLFDNKNVDGIELLFYNLGIKGLERDVCLSKLRAERGTEFLKKRKDVTQKQYNNALRNIKELLKDLLNKHKY